MRSDLIADICFFAGDSRIPEARLLVRNNPTFSRSPVFMSSRERSLGALIEQSMKTAF
jgi:hypothetical protein